tara:strand:+ start:1009 stop:1512 length:504 start_codon:yes stop_codon:yes gene_type:complete
MKKILLFVLLSFIIISCNNNSGTKNTEIIQNKESLEKTFKDDVTKFIECLNKKDWDTFWNMMNPKIFEFFEKEKLMAEMEKMIEENDVNFNNLEIGKMSKVISENNFNYCRIFYNYDMLINNEFIEKVETSVIASSKNGYNNWTYLEYTDESEAIVREIIPVIDQLN